MEDWQSYVEELGRSARRASEQLTTLNGEARTFAPRKIGESLRAARDELIAANALDIAAAEQAGLQPALVARLALNDKRISAMADGVGADRGAGGSDRANHRGIRAAQRSAHSEGGACRWAWCSSFMRAGRTSPATRPPCASRAATRSFFAAGRRPSLQSWQLRQIVADGLKDGGYRSAGSAACGVNRSRAGSVPAQAGPVHRPGDSARR